MQQPTKRRDNEAAGLFRRARTTTRKPRDRGKTEPAKKEALEKQRPVSESESESESSEAVVTRADAHALQYAKFLGGLATVGLLVSLGATLGIVGLSLLILSFGWVTGVLA